MIINQRDVLQPELPYVGRRIDINKRSKHEEIQYIGEAQEQIDGTWNCLANINGMLCWVKVNIIFEE